MRVGFRVLRDIVVDDVRQFVDVDASGGHVCRDEDVEFVLSEFFHDAGALFLDDIAVDDVGIIASFFQFRDDFIGSVFSGAEDQTVEIRIGVDDTAECFEFERG